MANEWTIADVLRVMKDKANAEGSVDIPEVHRAFAIKSRKIGALFDRDLETLIAEGKVIRNARGYVVPKERVKPEPKMITVAIISERKGEAIARLFKSEEAALTVLTNEFTMEDEDVPAKTLDELNEFLDGQYTVALSQQEVE